MGGCRRELATGACRRLCRGRLGRSRRRRCRGLFLRLRHNRHPERPVPAMADDDIPADEGRLLERVKASLAARAVPHKRRDPRYDQELMALRDEAGEARLEDVPALIAQMERLEGVSMKRAEGQGMLVDPDAPYFGHLRLKERA